MNTKRFVSSALLAALPALAQSAAPPAASAKVGIVHIQQAIVSTKDGQKALGELQARFMPKKAEIDKKQADIAGLQEKLKKGSNTLSDEARQQLMRDIDQKTKSLNREAEDAQAELDQDQQRMMQDLGGRMMAVLDRYGKDHGYTIIFDVSNQGSGVLFAANGIDITPEVVALYDKASTTAAPAPGVSSGAAAPAPGAPAARPPAASPVVRPPVAAPPAKK